MKIHITPTLYTKLRYLVENYNIEIGGYLTGEIRNKEVYLNDILIPSQNISAVHVRITPQDQLELRRKYKDKVFKIIGHFHSHHTMGAFWSGTDENLMRNVMETKDFFVFIVGSTTGFKIRVSVRNPISFDIEDNEFEINSLDFNNFKNNIDKVFNSNDSYRKNLDEEEVEEDDEDLIGKDLDIDEEDKDDDDLEKYR